MNFVRDAQLRTLSALGYQIGKSKTYRQVRVLEATGKDKENLFLLASVILGPSWPTLAHWLQHLEIDFRILDAGKIFLVVSSEQFSIGAIEEFDKEQISVKSTHVYIQDHGFVETRRRKKFESRFVVLPALSLLGTLGVASLGFPTQIAEVEEISVSCILDLKSNEVSSWLQQLLIQNPSWLNSEPISLKSELGTLLIQSTQSIGTTNFVSAQIACDNHNPGRISFRTDSSGGGIYSLVLELDS